LRKEWRINFGAGLRLYHPLLYLLEPL